MSERRVVKRKHTRSSATPTQSVFDKRMREIWIDGFGLLPHHPDELQLDRMRLALRRVVEDDLYWANLKKLLLLKDDVARMIERLKADNVQPTSQKRIAGGKAK